MKKQILALVIFLLNADIIMAEQISNVEQSGSWVYFYNTQGKKYKTMSSSTVGVIKGFSSNIVVSQNGSWVYIWDSEGKKIHTMSASTTGDIIGVAGDTFTSKNGSWIYTWDKKGKKINTRSAH